MAKVITIHSFQRGTGKSSLTANLGVLLASGGRRIGVVDTDVEAPSVHILFGLDEDDITYSLNDYLFSRCDIEQTAYDMTDALNLPLDGKGRIFLIPSSIHTSEIAQMLHRGYEVELFNEGLQGLTTALELDVLVLDTHAGLNEETLLSLAMSDTLAIVLRLDRQDYEGTGVTVEVARKLAVPRLLLVVNMVPRGFDLSQVKAEVERTYGYEVGAMLPFSDAMTSLASRSLYVLRYPDDALTSSLRDLADRLVA